MKYLNGSVALIALGVAATACMADTGPTQSPPPSVRIDANGTAHITEFSVPLSSYMSEEAKKAFIAASRQPPEPEWEDVNATVRKLRELDEADSRALVERTRARYAVRIEERRFAGVPTRVIIPAAGVAPGNQRRVLLNLHGGGFFSGAYGEALLESIPVAAVGGFKVITVDYREGPEYRFPAASEDVAAVYGELLKDHRPSDIGVYGCSAGGTLSAMSMAWFHKQGLPMPGAIGILNAGAYGDFDAAPSTPGSWGGDSRFTAPPLGGEPPLPIHGNPPLRPTVTGVYLRGVNLGDPLVSPALWPSVLATFPPTLIITSTRGFDMSAAVQTHRQLVNAGVAAELHVWDGVGHCFFIDVDLPESREAFAVITHFFDRRLSH